MSDWIRHIQTIELGGDGIDWLKSQHLRVQRELGNAYFESKYTNNQDRIIWLGEVLKIIEKRLGPVHTPRQQGPNQ